MGSLDALFSEMDLNWALVCSIQILLPSRAYTVVIQILPVPIVARLWFEFPILLRFYSRDSASFAAAFPGIAVRS